VDWLERLLKEGLARPLAFKPTLGQAELGYRRITGPLNEAVRPFSSLSALLTARLLMTLEVAF